MQVRAFLERLRDGAVPSPQDMAAFAKILGDPAVTDAQVGAFAMGVCKTQLDDAARVALTTGMRDSGVCLTWDVPGPVIDKHSTGGVGDAVSLMLAPLLASCGAFVPMISGRGLGHTGGTLDKLEAIPGLATALPPDRFRQTVAACGCAIVAATPDIAPADRRLYSVRDVTGTVRSLDLITASILSKKLAAGLGALVLDVKVGTGAVMQDLDDARALAQALVDTANGAGCPTTALITDMNQPLLPAIGNAVEIAAVMEAFKTGQGDFVDLVVALGASVLSAVVDQDEAACAQTLRRALQDGSAVEAFGKMIAAQGGPSNFIDRWQDYVDLGPATEVTAPVAGFVADMNAKALGELVVRLGGGRAAETDRIDHGVGLGQVVRLGQYVQKGQPLALVHARSDDAARHAADTVRASIRLAGTAPDPVPLIHERLMP